MLITQLVVHFVDGHVQKFALGAHQPQLPPEDVERIVKIRVDAVKVAGPQCIIATSFAAALDSLEGELQTSREKARARFHVGRSL